MELRRRDGPRGTIRFSDSIATEASPTDAFEALADMATLDTWNPNVMSSRRTRGERLEVGSEYVSTIRRGLIRMRATSRLVQCAPGRLVVYESNISGFHSIDGIHFEATAAGTVITFVNESVPPVWLRPLTRLLAASFHPQARRAVSGARRALEALAQEPS